MKRKEMGVWLTDFINFDGLRARVKATANLMEGEPQNGCATYITDSFTYTVGNRTFTLKEGDDWTEVKEYIERYYKGEQANLNTRSVNDDR